MIRLIGNAMVAALAIAFAPQADMKLQLMREDTKRALALRESTIETVRVRATYQARVHRSGAGAGMTDKAQVVDALIDFKRGGDPLDPFVKVDVLETPDPDAVKYLKAGQKWFRYSASSGPNGHRRVSDFTSTGRPSGNITRVTMVGWLVPVPEILSLPPSPVSRMIADESSLIRAIVAEKVGKDDALRFDWEGPALTGGGQWAGSVWVVPKMKFTVVREIRRWRVNDHAPWQEMLRKECENLVEVGGFWLPLKARFIEHADEDKGAGRELIVDCTATFEGWHLNEPIAEKELSVVFPPGTLVRDHLKGGASYVQGQVNDREVRRQVEKAKALGVSILPPHDPAQEVRFNEVSNGMARSSRGWGNSFVWAGAGVAILGSIIGGYLVTRRAGVGS